MLKKTGTTLGGGIFITNEDYIQWKGLIKKVAWKYRNNIHKLDVDDLEQIAAIGVMYGIDKYDEDKTASLKTWLYNNAKWKIQREFLNLRRVKRELDYKNISLNEFVNLEEDITLEEIISDDTVNIEAETLDKLIIEKYIEEIKLCIYDPSHQDIIKKTLFTELTLEQIGKPYKFSREKVKQIKNKGYRTLREKSPMIRAKYLEYKEREQEEYFLNEYRSNPESVVLREITSEKIKQKYKKEMKILDMLQTLFDFIDGYFYDDLNIKNFYLGELKNILSEKEIDILNQYTFLKISLGVLIFEGYDSYDVIGNKRNIKNKIVTNKEQVYEIWRNYIERDREKVNELSC